jgi:ubiquinone/menaquinone biosynthesis C-methylase UbiE
VKNDPLIKSDKFYDGETIPYDSGYFDCIICTEVVSHVKNLDTFFSEMYRVIKQDGLILITTPFITALSEYPNDFRRFTIAGLVNYCQKNKFNILDYEKIITGKQSIERVILSEIHKYNLKKIKEYFGLKKKIFALYIFLCIKLSKYLFNFLYKINGFEDVYSVNFIIIQKGK